MTSRRSAQRGRFGVETTLAAMSFYATYKQMGGTNCCMFHGIHPHPQAVALMSAAQALSAAFIQTGFITHRNYPGGPSQFFIEQYSTPMAQVQSVSSFLIIFRIAQGRDGVRPPVEPWHLSQ